MVPEFGKLPDLMDCENFSAFELVVLAPFANPFFRPEDKYGCSSEDQVIIPAGEGEREVYE